MPSCRSTSALTKREAERFVWVERMDGSQCQRMMILHFSLPSLLYCRLSTRMRKRTKFIRENCIQVKLNHFKLILTRFRFNLKPIFRHLSHNSTFMFWFSSFMWNFTRCNRCKTFGTLMILIRHILNNLNLEVNNHIQYLSYFWYLRLDYVNGISQLNVNFMILYHDFSENPWNWKELKISLKQNPLGYSVSSEALLEMVANIFSTIHNFNT